MKLSPTLRLAIGCGAVLLVGVALALVLYLHSVPKTFTNSVGMVMVQVTPGEFMMGSTKQEREWALANHAQEVWTAREGTRTKIRLTRPFWIAATEVTVGQFSEFVKATGYRSWAHRGVLPLTWDHRERGWSKTAGRSWENPGWPQEDSHPAVCLTYLDASSFCHWLTKKERKDGVITDGQRYRLPTEAEWEYACRGGRNTRFAWGDAPEDAVYFANVGELSPQPPGRPEKRARRDKWFFTAPVGSLRPTTHGLYDMHGNAWEWCMNFFYVYAEHETTDPRGAPKAPRRVMRGGSWDNIPASFRSAVRRAENSKFSSDTTGMRVVLVGGAD